LTIRTASWLVATLTLGFIATAIRADELVVADKGATQATIVVAATAGEWEKKAAEDLAKYIEMMSGAKVPVGAAAGNGPTIYIGAAAIAADGSLNEALAKAAKKNPILRADAVVLKRRGNKLLIAGNNDESHYYAVAELLRRWGCRWYVPTEFGECVPDKPRLAVDKLDYAYGSPFEVRKYWLSWDGDTTGQGEFQHRNFMNNQFVPNGHNMEKYVKDLVPAGKTPFNVPISDPKTAEHVAAQAAADFAAGKDVMLGMDDGLYVSDYARDNDLKANLQDKYYLTFNMTDPFFDFYNNVARTLLKAKPDSKSKIGFLVYSNITIPPQRDTVAEKPLVAYIAPIDIDPIHAMDDPSAPARQEYGAMMERWAEVMQGRLAIYDYDQNMMVWRDIPNPSHMAFERDVPHYLKAGILGVDTESRGATATTMLNLYFRGQLLWDPKATTEAELKEFYVNFYGPAAEPMSQYWTAIFERWKNTVVSEHEYFLIPAIYPREFVKGLAKHVAAAEKAAAGAGDSRNGKHFAERVKFTRLCYDLLDQTTAMIEAAATNADFAAAAEAGKKALATRETLTTMNPTFTTYKVIGENGPAWFPGEVQMYGDLAKKLDGKVVARLPVEWAFRRDPHDTGLARSWGRATPDLAAWNKSESTTDPVARHLRFQSGDWEMVRTDLYLQAQGILHPDFQSFTGYGWYNTSIKLDGGQAAGKVHLLFPGVFNECWLYVNGSMVSHREQKGVWWMNDYKLDWDVDLSGVLKEGVNTISMRIFNPHHFGGIFRRPLLYRAP
jgi:hypothetical protein